MKSIIILAAAAVAITPALAETSAPSERAKKAACKAAEDTTGSRLGRGRACRKPKVAVKKVESSPLKTAEQDANRPTTETPQ